MDADLDGHYIVKSSTATYQNTAIYAASDIKLDKNTMVSVLDQEANTDATYSVQVTKASNEGAAAIQAAVNDPDKTIEAVDIKIIETTANGEKDVTGTFNEKLSGGIQVTYKLPVKASSVAAYHYNGTIVEEVPATLAEDGRTITFNANGFSDWAIVYTADPDVHYEMTDVVGISFERSGDGVYNIMLRPQDDKMIYRFMSTDLTFLLEADKLGTLVYTIAADSGINLIQKDDNRYEFNLDGVTKSGITSDAIKIGTVSFGGYGKGRFTVAAAETNVVNTAIQQTDGANNIVDDNLVIHYTADGQVETGNKLALADEVINRNGVIDPIEMKQERRKLTVDVTFPNHVQDNDAAVYQTMTVTITGGDLTAEKSIKLGKNAVNTASYATVKYVPADAGTNTDAKYTVVFTNELTKGISYTVTVEGAGYRTARYTVLMDSDKKLTFWNNVKDADMAVEENKIGSAKQVTFLAGDIVKDNDINLYDLSAVVSYFGTGNLVKDYHAYAQYDLNRDGVIDSKDVAYVLVSWGN